MKTVTEPLAKATLAQVRSFVAVCQFEHFGEAASHLGISQPTLSQSLLELERGLGVPLVERSSRRMLITEEGRRLLPYAQRVVIAADDLLDAANVGSIGPTNVRVGLIPTIAPYLVGGLLGRLDPERIHIDIYERKTSELVDALAAGIIDVAILALPVSGPPSFVTVPLYREPFVLAVPPGHAWSRGDNVDPAALSDQRLVVLEEGHCLRDETLAVCNRGKRNVGHGVLVEVATIATMVQLVGTGAGVAVLPLSAAQASMRAANIVVAQFTAPVPFRDIGMLYRKASPAAEAYQKLAQTVITLSEEMGIAVPALEAM